MRKLLAVVVAVTALSLGLGSPANAQVDCNGVLVDLRLDDGTDVGDVTVTCPAANTLLMLFQVDPPYILLEVSGFVEDDEDCGGVEVTKRGNVKVGKFPESMMFSKQAEETSATLTFDISGFTQDDACGAGHVDVRNLAPPPPVDEAWADDGAASNQRINLFVECEDGGTAGFIDMHVDAERQGGGPKFSIPLANCIINEVQAHELGGGAPATDGLSGLTVGTCDTTNEVSLPADYTVVANCTAVNALPGFVNTIGVEGLFDIRTTPPEGGFIGMVFPFHCNIPNNC